MWHFFSYYLQHIEHQWENRQITPLAVISIFSLTLVSHNISAAARLECRSNLRGVLPHIEYPWAASQLSKFSYSSLAPKTTPPISTPACISLWTWSLSWLRCCLIMHLSSVTRPAEGVRRTRKMRSVSPSPPHRGRCRTHGRKTKGDHLVQFSHLCQSNKKIDKIFTSVRRSLYLHIYE